nr:MAG TPA: hypothetical protein [Caudoviricetes sp.]
MANKKPVVTKENVKDVIKMVHEFAERGTKKGVAVKKLQERFGFSAATAKSVLEGDDAIKAMVADMVEDQKAKERAVEESGQLSLTDYVADDVKEPSVEPVKRVSKTVKKDIIIGEPDPTVGCPPVIDKVNVFDDPSIPINPWADYSDDTDKFTGQLIIAKKIGKDIKNELAVERIDRATMRMYVDRFYQAQKQRIIVDNQIRAVEQGSDESNTGTSTNDWLSGMYHAIEAGCKEILNAYTLHDPVSIWMREIQGIGPAFAAGLRGFLDVHKANYATGFISWAGLNDRNCPWLGTEKAKAVMADTWIELGMKKGEITPEYMERLAIKTGRTYAKILHNATTKYDGRTRKLIQLKAPDAAVLAKNLAKVPYNRDLKVHMFKIADRFNKMPTNTHSLYTQIMLTRKAIETERNERGEYAAYAAKMLAEKNISDKKTKDLLKAGFLPKGQIQLRAYRVANEILLSHIFDAMWIYEYGRYPARYYALECLNHQGEIFPEVPYDDLFIAYEKRTGKKADRTRTFPTIDENEESLRNRVEAVVERQYSVQQYLDDINAYNTAAEYDNTED